MFKCFLYFIIIFGTLTSHVHAAKSSTNKHKTEFLTPEQFVNHKILRINSFDKITANHISSILKLSSLQFLNNHILKKTISNIKSNRTFRVFLPWIKKLDQIHQSSNLNKTITYCSESSNITNINYLNSNLVSFCKFKVLNQISKKITSDQGISISHINYIKENLDFYFSKNQYNHFLTSLNQIRSNERMFNYFSEIITEYIIQNNLTPNSELTQKIAISPTLTKYIQIKGLDKNSSESIFYTELVILTDKIYSDYDTAINKSQLIKDLKSVLNFSELNSSHLPRSRTSDKLIHLSKFLIRRNLLDESRFILNYVKKNSTAYFTNKAHFYNLWTYIQEDRLNYAQNYIENEELFNKLPQFDEQMLFWISYVLNKNERVEKLDSVLAILMKQSPLGYYTIMANSLNPKHNHFMNIVNNENSNFISMKDINPESINTLKRIKVWNEIDDNALLDLELDFIADSNNKSNSTEIQNQLTLISSKILSDKKNHLSAFKNIYRAFDFTDLKLSRSALEILFPKPFISQVKNLNSNIDSHIILSLIRQESGFDPDAKSRVGATGLMQLMPATAKMISGIKNPKSLHNPGINIKVGTKYLDYLLKKYENNLVYSLSAYNAGETRVNRWQNLFFKNNNFMQLIESIPFQETKTYVQLIFRNYFFYKLLENKIDDSIKKSPESLFEVSMNTKR